MSDQILGLAEMAEHFGVSKQVIHNWRKRGRIPEPAVQLAMSPIWYLDQIKSYSYDPITKILSRE